MTTRGGFTMNGIHFHQTDSTRAGRPQTFLFLDGKRVSREAYNEALEGAKAAETASATRKVPGALKAEAEEAAAAAAAQNAPAIGKANPMPAAWEPPGSTEQDLDVADAVAERAAYRAEQEAELATANGAQQPAAPRQGLRAAAEAAVIAWQAGTEAALRDAMAALEAALTKPASATREPRGDSKQATVITMLQREEGASNLAIAEATGWQPHTVRGFLAGLKRKGHQVEALERVRMVGPNRGGAKGSYTTYRIPTA
jgi:hypothetical protein